MLSAALAADSFSNFTQIEEPMPDPIAPVTVVSHVAVNIEVPPDVLWKTISSDLLSLEAWRNAGYGVASLSDAAVPLGGYRLTKKAGQNVVDERIVHVIERDEQARRLSLFSEHLSEPGGLSVHATYHVRDTPSGASCAIDCHTRIGLQIAEEADVPGLIGDMREQSEAHLLAYLERVRLTLESPQS